MAQPAWRRVFDTVERAVGEPAEKLVASNVFVQVAVLQMRAQKKLMRGARGAIARPMGTVLHALNVPTHSDVRKLSQQLAGLTSEVRALGAAPPPAPRARAPRSDA